MCVWSLGDAASVPQSVPILPAVPRPFAQTSNPPGGHSISRGKIAEVLHEFKAQGQVCEAECAFVVVITIFLRKLGMFIAFDKSLLSSSRCQEEVMSQIAAFCLCK